MFAIHSHSKITPKNQIHFAINGEKTYLLYTSIINSIITYQAMKTVNSVVNLLPKYRVAHKDTAHVQKA